MGYTFIQKIFPPEIPHRNFIFIPLFFTFYIVLIVFEPSSLLLQHFIGRSVSVATYEAIDIGKRVSLFYRAVGLAFVLFFLFSRLIILIWKYLNEEELELTNGISLAGFCLLFFKLLGADMSASLHFILALLTICTAGFIFHQTKKNYAFDFKTTFTWTILISVSLFFLQWQVTNFLIGKILFSLPIIIVIAGTPIYLLFTGRFTLNNKIFTATKPLIFFPLISFLSMELYMILNQRGIYSSPAIIYFAGLLFILSRCFIIFKNYEQNFLVPSLPDIFGNWIPWVIAGIACLAFYQPVVQPGIDWFEDANHVLPLHQWFSFGKIPFLDSFSSHAFSDFGFGLIYSIFNGADPMGVFVYSFFSGVIVLLIIYFFIYKLTRDGFLATWLTLAYPYTIFLIPSYFNFVPLTAIALIHLHERQSAGRYVLFFCSLLFMIFWRIDLGSSTLLAGVLSYIFLLFFVPSFKVFKKDLFNGLGITFSIVLLLFIVAYIHSGSHLFVSLKDALAYISSFQSYGLKDLSYVHDKSYFSLYFILPAIILLILIHSIYNLSSRYRYERNEIVYPLVIIFFGLFYFANLQRGLVRHTLAEQWDDALTSFGYFIICMMIFFMYIYKKQLPRFFVFFIVCTVIISNYVFTTPDLKSNNYYSYITTGINKTFSLPVTRTKIQRIKEDPAYINEYGELSEWMNKNISGKSTFLDFSNTPMLYYFTNRIVPNYFDQVPHTAHNDYLQNRFIDDLKNFDIPVTIFSNVPQTFWDNLDGIPNTLRHYRIAEFIYRNYKPAYVINHHSVWIKKSQALNFNEKELLSVSVSDMISDKVTIREDKTLYAEDDHGSLTYQPVVPVSYDNHKIFMTMTVYSNKEGQLIIYYKSSSGNFNDRQKTIKKIHGGNNTVFVMASPIENDRDIGTIRFELPEKASLKFSDLKIISAEYYKDLFSTTPPEYILKWIPYVWGNFDKNYIAGNITKEEIVLPGMKLFKADTETGIAFNPVKDKESGNYIKVTARVPSGKMTNVYLSYGAEKEKNGSFSFTLKDDSLSHDYLIRVSSQYNWYCKNNSWMTFYPVENEIEINNIEILKGD